MNINEAIKSRKSIRGYKPDPVPKEILKEILEIATYSPSGRNTQPWEITVIAGELMEKIKRANVDKFNSEEALPQTKAVRGIYTGKYRERQIALAVQLFQLMNIAREDKEGRTEWTRKGLRFFDAPAAIIISKDESLGPRAQFSIGAFSQTIALTALNYGLGTCMQGQTVRYPDVIRKFTGIPESKDIIIGIAIGYPDWDFPANKVHSKRESVEDITTWCGL